MEKVTTRCLHFTMSLLLYQKSKAVYAILHSVNVSRLAQWQRDQLQVDKW